MIYIIVGGSRAGKTTLTENSFLKGRDNRTYRDLFTLTENDEYILFGTYEVDGRRKGTDTTNRKDIQRYYEQIVRLKDTGKHIVLEGTRLSTKLLFQILTGGHDCQIVWVRCSPQKILERNREKGNEQSESHFRAEVTKAKYMFWKYAPFFDGMIVDTEGINHAEQWENISIHSEEYIVRRGTDDYTRYFIEYCQEISSKCMHESDTFGECFVNVITNPSFVKVSEKGCFQSRLRYENAVPKIISEKWRKHA